METLKKQNLFWDITAIDPKKDSRFVIERILMFGDKEDFRWANDFYGPATIKEVLKKSRNLDKKSLSFWCQFFNINEDECILNQSANKQELSWQR